MVDSSERSHLKLVDGSQPSDIDAEFIPLPYYPWDRRPSHLPIDVEEAATAFYLSEGMIAPRCGAVQGRASQAGSA